MADISILDPSVKAAPKAYLIKGSQEIILKGVTASFDGTSAASRSANAKRKRDIDSGLGMASAGRSLAPAAPVAYSAKPLGSVPILSRL